MRTIDFVGLGVVWRVSFENAMATVLAGEALCAAIQVVVADLAPLKPVLASTEMHVTLTLSGSATETDEISLITADERSVGFGVTMPPPSEDIEQRARLLTTLAVALIAAVQLRPIEEYQSLIQDRMRQGLREKVFFGRPYEDAAELLDAGHYQRLAALSRPPACDTFEPAEHSSIMAPTADGPGYDPAAARSAITERYRAAHNILPNTLARLMASEAGRELVTGLRAEGWLDWHILSSLLNMVGNSRLHAAGVALTEELEPELERLRSIMFKPDSEEPVEMAPADFTREALQAHMDGVVLLSAQAQKLTPAASANAVAGFLGPLTSRYHFFTDDVPHTDLLACVDEDGALIPFVGATTH